MESHKAQAIKILTDAGCKVNGDTIENIPVNFHKAMELQDQLEEIEFVNSEGEKCVYQIVGNQLTVCEC